MDGVYSGAGKLAGSQSTSFGCLTEVSPLQNFKGLNLALTKPGWLPTQPAARCGAFEDMLNAATVWRPT